MLDRRRAVALAFAALAAGAPFTPAARAQTGFQAFVPFLVDLSGWKGGKPDGITMEIPGNRMITATREYERGPARLTAQVIIGPPAQGALAAASGMVKIETADARISTSTIDGMQVTRTFTIGDKSGAVMVALGVSAAFILQFNGIGDDEALALARGFNWKAIQAAVPK
jgi:hypothetical protein